MQNRRVRESVGAEFEAFSTKMDERFSSIDPDEVPTAKKKKAGVLLNAYMECFGNLTFDAKALLDSGDAELPILEGELPPTAGEAVDDVSPHNEAKHVPDEADPKPREPGVYRMKRPSSAP